MRFKARLSIILALFVLAGCGELPRPFAHSTVDTKNPLLVLRDGAGLKVNPIVGAPGEIAMRLADGLAVGFREANIAASAAPEFTGGYTLTGEMDPLDTEARVADVKITWRLTDSAGAQIGTVEQKVSGEVAGWKSADPDLIEVVTARAVPPIAAFLQDAGPEAAPVEQKIKLSVGDIKGAPGDDGSTLKRALAHHLGQNGIEVNKSATSDALLIEGTVQLTDLRPGEQRLAVVWVVSNANGKELGKVRQANTVPAATLKNRWGEVAFAIAGGASSGIVDLLKRAQIESR